MEYLRTHHPRVMKFQSALDDSKPDGGFVDTVEEDAGEGILALVNLFMPMITEAISWVDPSFKDTTKGKKKDVATVLEWLLESHWTEYLSEDTL